ncbi:MAG: O-methyltransferase [Lutibacter sp.]|jgi:predicted O-methyltransferase YrrM|nr:O-methyltransferase [Lutibacter sp.]
MNFLPDAIDRYVVNHSQEAPALLQQLEKETWQRVLSPRMLCGAYQGRILAMISKMSRPRRILEIGTYTGYSALCLAEGLPEDGQLITIDINEERHHFVQQFFDKSPYKDQLTPMVGNALDLIPTLNDTWDLVFIDADKTNYVNYFKLIIDKMNPGGIILSDNVLWSGKVVEKPDPEDVDTNTLVTYNELLRSDKRIETLVLPVRDGLTISRVK